MMKKLLVLFLFLLASLSFMGIVFKAAPPTESFDVTLTTMFDGDNSSIASEMTNQNYGT
jgi:hypothetical protein